MPLHLPIVCKGRKDGFVYEFSQCPLRREKAEMLFWRIALLGFLIGIAGEVFVLKFKVVHEAIVDCPNKGTDEIQVRWKLRKVNRTLQIMYGYINLLRDFDDSLVIKARLMTWQNGGWKAGTGLDFKKDKACSSLTLVLGQVWQEIMASAHGSPKCPVKKGNYSLEPMDARVWDKLPLPGAPVNKYKLAFHFETEDGVARGCYSSVFRVAKK